MPGPIAQNASATSDAEAESQEASRPALAPSRPAVLRYLPAGAGALLFLAAAALYVRTLAPSVMPGDYAEFQFCAAILGVPHPTGYPLYVLLGKLFTLLPVGDVAFRVNLSSAIYMSGAGALLYAIARRLLKQMGLQRAWWAAATGAALFAVAPTVWSMALVARSYALNALLVGGVVLTLVLWRETARPRWFFAACLLIGLSMVHHATTYLLLPAYGLFLIIVEVERSRRRVDGGAWRRRGMGILCWALGYSPLLFLVYRFLLGSPYYWGSPTTWNDFFYLLTGGPFHDQVFGFGTGLDVQIGRVVFGVGQLSDQFTWLGIVAGLTGLVVLWRQRRAEAALLTLMLAGNFGFAMNYALVGYLYFIPTYLIWGVLVAIGAAWLASLAGGATRARLGQVTVAAGFGALAVALLAAIVALAALRFAGVDQSGQTATRDRALALLQAAPPGASLYFDWEELSVLRFYRLVYGMRPDITLHSGDPVDWPKSVYCDVTNGAPVYVGIFAGAVPPVVERDFLLQPAPMSWRVVGIANAARYEIPPCGTCATCR